ncbi:MAG: cyanophycinase [Acidimicrobiales bacterium]
MSHPSRAPRGTLFAIGGAEDKLKRRAVLARFVEAAGGAEACIVVMPTASSLGPEIVQLYDGIFRAMGAGEVVGLRPESRADADHEGAASTVAGASGVFMTGGNQLKLSAVLTGTRLGDAIHHAYAKGAAVGGTSAGASVLSEHMVAFGPGGATPKQRMSQLAAGLGLLPGCVVDQHFQQRNRYGRLLYLVGQSPSLLGVGVDEDTAAIVTGGRFMEVAGRGSVTIIDGHEARSNADAARRTNPVLVSGARLHVLPAGARFDLVDRELIGFDSLGPVEEAVGHDIEKRLRAVVHDIAVEGVGPANLRRQRRRQAWLRDVSADDSRQGVDD